MRDGWAYASVAVLAAMVVGMFVRVGVRAAAQRVENMRPVSFAVNVGRECAIHKALPGPAQDAYQRDLGYDPCVEELARMTGQGRALPLKAGR